MRETVTNSSGLSEDEVNILRGLVVRRRTREAERWLLRRGFNEERARQLVLNQEMAVANLLYLVPSRDFIIAVILAFFGVAAFGFAKNDPVDPSYPGFWPNGTSTGAYVLLIIFGTAAALFLVRASWAAVRYVLALIRYPVRRSLAGEFDS